MGARSRETALAEFALTRVIQETMAVYREILTVAEAGLKPGRIYFVLKRAFDCVASGAGLALLLPALAAIALAVKAGSRGPVFYRGVRTGLNGEPFRIFKFRSMVVDAEALGGSATANGDPRITRIGAFLRRHKLDELPQLLNVLAGSMTLVGPRPEVQKYVNLYAGEEQTILSMKPGITDWASIWNSDEGSVLEGAADPERAYEDLILPTKTTLQLFYLRHRSFGTDLRILFYTLVKLLRPDWVPRELAPFGRIRPYKTLQQEA
jgi:lipopolysaccharide/colanic/teichoic acid biosynthesis glycosyltransferase